MLFLARDRHLVPEKMDDPNLDPELHRQALAGLRRINGISQTTSQLTSQIRQLVAAHQLDQPTILDIGCGSGDVTTGLAIQLKKIGIHAKVTGWDISATATEQATDGSRTSGVDVQFCQRNVFCQKNSEESSENCKFDFVYCTLFLHHLDREQAIGLLATMRSLARYAAIVSDLKRTNLGWIMAYVGCRLLSRSEVVRYDGPQSVRAAFLPQEAVALAKMAEWRTTKVVSQWPQRFFMIGR